MHTKITAFAIVFLCGAGTATASELYSPKAAYDWSGLYAGVHAGFATDATSVATTLLDENGDKYIPEHPAHNAFNGSGAFAGIQGGYNFQSGGLVLGIEGDVSWAGIAGSFNFDTNRPEAIAGNDISWLASVRGRIGAAFDRTLIYGTAGVVVAGFHGYANNVWAIAPTVDVASDSGAQPGIVIGGGAEFALTDTLSLKGEYLYSHFKRSVYMVSAAYPAGTTMLTDSSIGMHQFKIGLNYRFR